MYIIFLKYIVKDYIIVFNINEVKKFKIINIKLLIEFFFFFFFFFFFYLKKFLNY